MCPLQCLVKLKELIYPEDTYAKMVNPVPVGILYEYLFTMDAKFALVRSGHTASSH